MIKDENVFPPIEAEPGPPPEGMTQEAWNAYVIAMIKRWRHIAFDEDRDDDGVTLPF